ncbi:anti-sigma factor domain-containing protein [Robertkochia sediminum]|uniref:anti-sigma factor domain-containing protein n=1 Tax=Robertkochia sediminum TaxID=2785326 RepID=UPI0019326169|nr:anti-sigma factor [Robertkochia sediminum]MBL7471655.1 anti-sigma factor [Robertkochia sediminum]
MKEAVKIFLEEDILERYVMGAADYEESLQAEHFISTYPQVKEEYDKLQEDLEQFARAYAKPLPASVRNSVLEEIKTQNTSEVTFEAPKKKFATWYMAAAIISTLLMGAATVTLWKQNQMLNSEKHNITEQVNLLKNDIVETNSKMEVLKSKFAVLSDPDTRQYVFEGNERAKNLRSVAYINPKDGLSAINIVSLPDLPKEKEFKMWAEVDGNMVLLGVLEKADQKLMSLPLTDKASSIQITIDNKGNKDFAAIDTEVARIDFTKE